eukprot:CAMPEP_0119326038 /NCGR_PEP_ID=MMETSP1333-20130426/67292_1 /TAXON_ID=418940 /ORGANISM="Scyphosphaera apsteinii, Strain RCC1455" /LENGTH=265 /DNA_ID=CAMNT_0007334215 /DNA_START=108 /DNA_END=905 /DNA_ORIENTATION=+
MQQGEVSQKARLREETEAPFAKVRLFVWPALFAAAGLASYFSATSALAAAVGVRPADPDTPINLLVDVCAIGSIGVLWRRDVTARDKRLKRIEAGARLAALRLRMFSAENSVAGSASSLSDLRGGRGQSKRVVIMCAAQEPLLSSLDAAEAFASRLFSADLLIVPLLLARRNAGAAVSALADDLYGNGDRRHLALPQGLEAWQAVLEVEIEAALKQDPTAMQRGFTLVLKKNGRVGTRRLGLPDWSGLVEDVDARTLAGLDTSNI